MSWHATLKLDYARQEAKTVARFRHNGPLGMAGQRCIATLFFVAGSKLASFVALAPASAQHLEINKPPLDVGPDQLDVNLVAHPQRVMP